MAGNPFVLDFGVPQNALAQWQQGRQFQQQQGLAREQMDWHRDNALAQRDFELQKLAQQDEQFRFTRQQHADDMRIKAPLLQAQANQANAHAQYYIVAGRKFAAPEPRGPDLGRRPDGTVYEIGGDDDPSRPRPPGAAPGGPIEPPSYSERRVLGDSSSVPPSTVREHETDGRSGVVTTDVPGVVTRPRSGASDRYASEKYAGQRVIASLPDEDRERYQKFIRDRQIREQVYGKTPSGYVRMADGRLVQERPPADTSADRQARVVAEQGLYNLGLAEKALVGDGKGGTVGTFGQIIGETYNVGGVKVGGIGPGGQAFRQAKRAVMDLNFALSGKSVSNAEREAFLDLYMPHASDSTATQAEKISAIRKFFAVVMAAKSRGATDDEIAAHYRGALHSAQGGSPSSPTSGGPSAPAGGPSPGVQKYGNKYQGLE